MTKVKLTYFKTTGKYYADGEYTSKQKDTYDIWDEVEDMFFIGKRPELTEGPQEFIVMIEVPDHPPRLVFPT